MDMLTIQNLSKSFGKHQVIDNLSLTVPEHSIFGFVGQNGAGKTTTMKMILGLLKPDEGTILVGGQPVRFGQNQTNRMIGYLPDVPSFYPYLYPLEFLQLCGEISGMPRDMIRQRSQELLRLVGLEGVKKKIGAFSRGMKQRLGIAQALLNQPKLLICDEPTSALDPVGRKEILDILQAVKGTTTVVFSTHILSDVERICDRMAVLHKGHIALTGTLAELRARHQAGLVIDFATPEDKDRFLSQIPSDLASGDQIQQQPLSVTLRTDDIRRIQAEVMQWLVKEQIYPRKMEVAEPSVESLYLEVISS